MLGRGEYQKQLAALVASANANNLKFDDILPDGLKEHFQEMTELQRAREYVKDLEEREKGLLAEKDALKMELSEKQIEIDNLPTEHQARKVELHQAERQIALYKETSEDLAKRAERYRRQLEDVVVQKQAGASATEKIEHLNTQIIDQQAVIDKLMDDNRKFEVMFQQLREADVKALDHKEKQLAKKDEMLAELRQQLKEAQVCKTASGTTWSESLDEFDDAETLVDGMSDDSLALQEQNIDLLQQNLSLSHDKEALQDECVMAKMEIAELKAASDDTKTQYHINQDRKAQLLAAAISEVKTLNRFYKAGFDVLNHFAEAFHTEKADMPSNTYIEEQLDTAQDALAGYISVKQVVRAVTDVTCADEDQVALYKELDSLGASAADSMSSLEILSTGFWRFLGQLSDDPKLLSHVNGALCDAGRLRAVELYSCR